MSTDRLGRLMLALLTGAAMLTPFGATAARAAPAQAAPASGTAAATELGCGSAGITHTLATGSAWRMCVRIHPFKGLVLEDLQFRPATGDREYPGWMPVLDSLYLAQLNVPYDTGSISFDDITSHGFGDDSLVPQRPDVCDGETMEIEQSFLRGTALVERTVPGVCLRETDAGLGWHSQEGWAQSGDRYAQQGRALEVSSLSKVGWYEYQQRITLTDQGTVTVGLGATGDLAPGTLFFPTDPSLGWPIGPDGDDLQQHAASHWHNAIYRVDFGIDSGPQRVEEWEHHRDPERLSRLRGHRTVREQAFMATETDSTTWWRVVNPASLNPDGHPRSYQIVNESIQNDYLPLTRPQVSFTNDHPCQEYASMNLNAECPGQSVLDYVAAETEPLTDPVAWVSVGYHHVPRDEDQSPMPAHWQSFSLVPRDLLAQQATTPAERSCRNGRDAGETGTCVAINHEPPVITAGTSPTRLGTLLTASEGVWRSARAPLSFDWLWLRNGSPIQTAGPDGLPAAATGSQYRVTAADLGRRISVQVTASAAGVLPGSAVSAPHAVPAASVSHPGPVVPNTAAAKTRPKLRAKVLRRAGRKGRPRLRIVVRGDRRAATGRITVRRHGKRIVTKKLRKGRTRVLLPRPRTRRYRVKVTYLGDHRHRKVSRRIWVRAPRGHR